MSDIRFEIDELDLVKECAMQPQQVANWQKRQGELEDELDRAEAAVKLSYARLDLAIRQNPEEYGLTKVSESSINAAIIADRLHQAQIEASFEAKAAFNKAKAAVQGLWSRDKMLGIIKDLYVHDYYQNLKNDADPDEDSRVLRRTRKEL